METKELLPSNYPLKTGDVIEVHTTASGLVWVQAWQWNAIERAVKADPHFELVNVTYGENQLIMRIRVVKNPITVATITALIIGAGISLLIFLSIDRVYKITTGDTGKALAGAGLSWGVAAALGGLYLFTKGR